VGAFVTWLFNTKLPAGTQGSGGVKVIITGVHVENDRGFRKANPLKDNQDLANPKTLRPLLRRGVGTKPAPQEGEGRRRGLGEHPGTKTLKEEVRQI